MSVCYLDGLPTEVILEIFSYLNYRDLNRMKQTCRRFNEIITTWASALLRHIVPIVTNQRSEKFLSRCVRKLDPFQQIRISKRWETSKFIMKMLEPDLWNLSIPLGWEDFARLHISREYVWLNRGKYIYCFRRNKKNIIVSRPVYVICGSSKSYVVSFAIQNNYLVSGLMDGGIYLKNLETQQSVFDKPHCHSYINSVDITKDGRVIVSGGPEDFVGGPECLSVWEVSYDSDGTKCSNAVLSRMYMKRIFASVLTVSMIDEGSHLAVGTSGNNDRSLFLLDMEKLEPVYLPWSCGTTRGFSIVDIKWDTPNTLWSCEFSLIRRWDIRSGKCVQILEQPYTNRYHYTSLNCFDYDYCNTIVAGANHGWIYLWDIRQKNTVQSWDLRGRDCLIQNLAFDSEYLFTVTGPYNLWVLDFSVHDEYVVDYSN